MSSTYLVKAWLKDTAGNHVGCPVLMVQAEAQSEAANKAYVYCARNVASLVSRVDVYSVTSDVIPVGPVEVINSGTASLLLGSF